MDELLAISRPGFYPVTAFMYCLPCLWHYGRYSAEVETGEDLGLRFWAGLGYVLFPVNLLVYGMNDFADQDVDKHNERKGSSWFGARASEAALRTAVTLGLLLVVPGAVFIMSSRRKALVWLTLVLGTNWLYNFGPRLSRVAVLDLFPPLGYLLCAPLGADAAGIEDLPMGLYMLISCVCLRTQLWLQHMDRDADLRANKWTTAVALGERATWVAVSSMILAEILVLESFLLPECTLAAVGCCSALRYWCLMSLCVFQLDNFWKPHISLVLMPLLGICFLPALWPEICMA